MLNAPFARVFRRMVSRVTAPGIRSRRTVLEVTQNTLECRLAPATLAAPVVDSTTLQYQRQGPPANTLLDYVNPTTAINPENPQKQVIFTQEYYNSATDGIRSFIRGKSSVDGGTTWSEFTRFGGGNISDESLAIRDPDQPGNAPAAQLYYREYSAPGTVITRDGQVYVTFVAHNAAYTSGLVGARRYDFSGTRAVPQLVSISGRAETDLNPFDAFVPSTNRLYQWTVGVDPVYYPAIAANNNVRTFSDPDSGFTITDPGAGTAAEGGNVYIGWATNAKQPQNFAGSFNPSSIAVVGTSGTTGNKGASWTGPIYVAPGFTAGVNAATSRPSLAVTGLNSVNATGAATPGQLVASWETNAANAKTIGVSVTPATGITIGGTSTAQVGIIDAKGTATPYTVTPTAYPVTVTGPTVTAGFTLADINVTLGVQHPDVGQLKVELVAPNGTTKLTLVQPRTDNTGFTQVVEPATGTTPGITGANMGFVNGVYVGTTFSDNAPRRISDPANTAPYTGTYWADTSNTRETSKNALINTFGGLSQAALIGTWTFNVYDQTAGPVGPPLPVTKIGLGQVSLTFASPGQGLRQSAVGATANTSISVAGRTVPTPNGDRALLGLVGSLTSHPFIPFGTLAPYGVGFAPSLAVDTSIGQSKSAANPSPLSGLSSGRIYAAFTAAVDLNLSGTLDPNDDLDVFVAAFDSTQPGLPLVGFTKLNSDSQKDNFSQGLRYQFDPKVAVDPLTGTLAATWQDARYDAANARSAQMLSTSIDGGLTFSPQVFLNQSRVATDVITGRELTIEPLVSNYSTFVVGNVNHTPLAAGLTFNNGRINVTFAGNPNAPGSYLYTATARTVTGPQVVYSDMGAIGNTVATDVTGNSAIQASKIQLDNPIAPTPPRFYQYNAARAGLNGQASLPGVADGTPLLDGIRVVFDRRIDTGDPAQPLASRVSSFNPDDVRVFFQPVAGGAPVELRTLYPNLSYRIDNLSDQTKGVTAANPTTPVALAGANIVTPDTDFVVRFVDALDPNTLVPVGLVGTYSYALSPYIRDRVRNTFAGLTPDGQMVTPATKAASGALIEPVTVSNTTRVDLETRGYQQPPLPQPNPFTGKYAVLPTNPPVFAYESNPTVALTNDLTLAAIPPKTYTDNAGNTVTLPGVPAPGTGNVIVDGVTDVPIAFPAGAFPSGQDKIARVLVQVDLVHTRRGQGGTYDGLILQLVSPGGKVIPLAVQTGGNGTAYDGFAFENTVFDSLASKSLQAGGNRFQGTYRTYQLATTTTPGGALATPDLTALNGDSPAGTWYLRIIDNFNGDNQYGTGLDPVSKAPIQTNPLGYLRGWSLTVVPGSVSAPGFGTTPAEVANSLRRGNPLDSDGDGAGWTPVLDSYRAPVSTAPLTLTGGPYQAGGKGLFEQGPFDKATLPVVIGGPRVLGVSPLPDDGNPATTADGRNLNDQVYVNRPADNLYVRFDRAVNLASINPAGLRITGPGGLIAGPFTVTAGATADEVVIGFAGSAGGSFTRGGSYTVQFDAAVTSSVGDAVDVNQNAGVDRLFGGNATTAAIQTITFGNSGGPVTIRSAPVVASAGSQAVTGETVAEMPIPVSQAFQIAQDLARFPGSRLGLNLQIRDTQNLAPGEVSRLFQSLTADLVAPDGTRVRLFTGLGNALAGPGTVSTNIVFDDAALSPIGAGVNPFQTAPYNPQIPLARLLGKWSFGTWKVVVTNTLFRIDPTTLLAVDVGQILSASLTLTKAAVSTGLGEARADETSLGFRVYNQDPTSKESSQVWQAVGASPSNTQANVGRVSAVTIDTADPTGNTVFAAGASGGVWKTTNFLTTDPDGPSWVPLTDFGPSTALNVASIAVFPRADPANPAAGLDPAFTVVFAQTGEGNSVNLPNGNNPWTKPGVGVLRSFDGGRTWTLMDSKTNSVTPANANPGETIGAILDVSDPRRDHFFVGASGFKIIVDPTPYQTQLGNPDRTSPNNLAVYMAVSDARPTGDAAFAGGVWRSLDSGRTWTRIGWGNATDVAFAPGAVGPDGSLQTLYLALLGAPGVTSGVYITRQATNIPEVPANSIQGLTYLLGGGGNNVIRDQLQGQNTAVGVGLVFGPFVSPTRITLAAPAATNSPLANNIYQSWLYALTSNGDGSLDGLFVTKDFGSNWTRVRLPELVDAFGDFWGHNDEFQPQVPKNLVDFNVSSQFNGSVAYTRDTGPVDPVSGVPVGQLSESPRTYVPRPGPVFSKYGTTPRATGQGVPGADESGGTGNRALSLAVDPLNPSVVFLGGDRSIRVDLSVVEDAQSYYYFENTGTFPVTLFNSQTAGGVTTRANPLMADNITGVGFPLENGLPVVNNQPWGVIIPGSANPIDTANGIAAVYKDKYGLPAGFVNLSKDPGNPFLNPSVIQVYNANTFTNTGENAKVRPFDNILFGSYDVTSIVPFVDPQTGKTRLIYGTANGIYTGVDTGSQSGATLDTAIGDSGFVTNPTQVARVVTGPRNGNLQIGQYYQGAVQPSRLAADIAGALFYAVSQDNGYPVSAPDVIESGNTAQRTGDWPGTGLQVATDGTGTGTAYQYRLPSSTGTDTTNTNFGNSTDFFRLQLPGADQSASGIGRTNNLLSGQNPFSNQGDWPLNDTRYGQFAVNPLDGAGIAISAAPQTAGTGGTARVFRSVDRGLSWENLGAPAGNAQYVSALAFGGPDANFPTQRNNYILAGTGDSSAAGYASGGTNGRVYFTVNGTLNSWVRVPGDAATGGRSVLKIVPNPRFGTSDFYVLTDRDVFYVTMNLNRANPGAVTATWTSLTNNLYGLTRALDSLAPGADGKTQTTVALRDTLGRQLDLTSLAVDWRYINPVLYVAGEGGTVFRTVTFNPALVVPGGNPPANVATWTSFPDNPTDSYADGGFLPNVRITDLDLSLGAVEQNYDPANPGRGGMPILGIDPITGLPRSGGALNLLVATTYGRGQFVTRINPADPALNPPAPPGNPVRPDAFVSGPKVGTIAFTFPDGTPRNTGGVSTMLDVVFDAPVDPVTLDPTDITLLDTTGAPLTVTSVRPVPAVVGQPDPRNRYTITFSNTDGTPVSTAGFYYLQVGNSKDLRISDLAGNRMNQNGNTLNGETFASPNGDDTFTTFVYLNGQENSLFVTGLPSKVSTWAPTTVTVTATKANGSVDAAFDGAISFASSDPNLSLPAAFDFNGTEGGRKSFTLTFRTGATITNPDGSLLAPVTDLVGLFQTVTINLDAASSTGAYNPGQVGAGVYNARVQVPPASLPLAVSAWDPQTTTAKVVDYNGNLLPAFAGTVTPTSSDGNAILPPAHTYVPISNAGSNTFSPTIFRTKGTQSLTYSGTAADGLDPLTVKTAVANAVLDVTGLASPVSTYDPQALTITVRSALDNKVLPAFNLATGPQATVSVTTDDPLADITPPVVQYPDGSNAVGTTELLFRTKGSPTRLVTFTSPIGVDTKTLTPEVVNAQFEVLNPDGTPFSPAALSTWNPQALTVNLVSPVANDPDGTPKVLPRFTGDVTVTSSDPLAAAVLPDSDPTNKLAPLSPSGQKYTYSAASAGSRVDTLLFRTGSSLSTGGTTQSFTFASPVGVDAKTVSTKVVNAVFNVSGLPNPANGDVATAGVGLSVNVAIADPLNNNATLPAFAGTVTLGSDDTKVTLAPNPFTYAAANNGNKAFVVTYRTSGGKTFTANTPVGVDPFGTVVPVEAADASKLTLAGFPTPVVAGTTGNFTVTAFDPFGNVATGFTGTVRLTSSDLQAGGLPTTYTFAAGDNGSKTFAVTLKTAGTQQLVASEQGGFGLSASQTGIVVTPADATQFTLFGYPGQTIAGEPHPLVLKASDPFGNTATNFTGVVTFSSSDAKVSAGDGLPTAFTFTSAEQGQKVFPAVALRTAGVQSITATSGAITSTQGGITVFAAPASTFDFGITSPASPPYSIPAGGQVGYQLVARDKFGNIDTKFGGTVQFTSSDPQASLPGAYTFNVNDGGQKGFASFLFSSGTQTISAADPISGAAGTSPLIEVQAATAGLLNVAGFPGTVAAGDSGTFSVTLFDSKGNVATGFTGTISFASSDPTAVFSLASAPGAAITSYTFSAGDNGTRQFVATLTKAGLQTLTVTPVTDPAVNSGTVSTTVQAATTTSFRVSEFQSPVDAGTPRLARVTALDRFGNQADNYGGLVRLTSSDPAAVLPAQSKLTGGTAFFLVTLNTPGQQSITASDTLDATVFGTQGGITVNGAPPVPVAKAPVLTTFPATAVVTGRSVTQAFGVTTFPLGAGVDGLVFAASATNAVLLPQSGLVFGGSGANRTLTVTPVAGQTGSTVVTVTVTDPTTNLFSTQQFAVTVDPVPLPPEPPPGSRTNLTAVGSDIGVLNRVTVYNPDGSVLNRLEPFAAGFTFGTRVATVRQQDGKQLIAAVPGPGRQTEVRILDPFSGATIRTLEGFESGFQGGLYVAAGDVNGDGWEDIAISPDQGGGGRVKVYDGRTFEQIADFFGIDDPTFRGGARVTFGDLNNDGRSDLIVAAGFGGGPRVALFDGSTVTGGRVPEKFMGDFFLFEQTLRNGMFIAAGDLNGDGFAELVAAGGPGGGPRVFALDGRGLMGGQFDPVANFFAGNPDNRGGVRVTVKNLDGDRLGDIVTGDGVGAGTSVRTYFGADLLRAGNNAQPDLGSEFEELPGATNGVFVG